MPFFSVIIPLYNKEAHIKSTINSVLAQSFQDFELIIINDGSTDNSLSISEQVTEDLKLVSIITQKNNGLSFSRNKGIQLAKGQVIALLDADDVWDKSFLDEIYKLHKGFPEASLYGTDYYEKYSDKNILEPKKNLDFSLKNKAFIIDDFFEKNLFQLIVSQSNFAFKKMVFESVQFNEETEFGEDVEFYIKSNLRFKFAYLYKPLATVHFNIPNQITSSSIKGKRFPNLDIFENEA